MTKLTFSKARKIFISIFAFAMTGGSGAGFFILLFKDADSLITWAAIFPLFIALTAISFLGIRQTFFAYCSFDDEAGMEFYYGIGKPLKIPLSALSDFYPLPDGISISCTVNKNGKKHKKMLRVPADFQQIQLLYEWLNEHAANTFMEEVKVSAQEFSEEHSVLSDEEKNQLLKKNWAVAKLFDWTGIAIAIFFFVSIFLGGQIKKIAFCICASYPLLLLMAARFSNGNIRFISRRSDVCPGLFWSFFYCSIALSASAFLYLDSVYSIQKMMAVSAVSVIFAASLYVALAADAEKRNLKSLAGILILTAFMYGGGTALTANVIFDSSEPALYEATVLGKRISGGRHKRKYLDISPWIDGKTEHKEVAAAGILYAESEAGDKVSVKLYGGKLGIPYFRVSKKIQDKE